MAKGRKPNDIVAAGPRAVEEYDRLRDAGVPMADAKARVLGRKTADKQIDRPVPLTPAVVRTSEEAERRIVDVMQRHQATVAKLQSPGALEALDSVVAELDAELISRLRSQSTAPDKAKATTDEIWALARIHGRMKALLAERVA